MCFSIYVCKQTIDLSRCKSNYYYHSILPPNEGFFDKKNKFFAELSINRTPKWGFFSSHDKKTPQGGYDGIFM